MNQTPQLDNQNEPMVVPQTESLKAEKSLSDRILLYALGASVLINLGWMVWVSHSDLFGKGSVIPPMKETQIKVFKRPLPPKPKPKIKPPPPPPKQPQPKPKPMPHIVHPHPTPPQPHRVTISVHTTHSQVSTNRISMPTQAPTTEPTGPAVPTNDTPTPPSPVTQPTPEAPPAPVVVAPPAPKPTPPAPKATPPPAPVVHPRNYSPVESQEGGPVDGVYEQADLPAGKDITSLSSTTVIVTYEVDENGHVSNPRVVKSSGDSDIDDACVDAIRRTHFQIAIQDHLKLRQQGRHEFPLSAN